MKLQRFQGNPILSPNGANPWEAAVATNPGAWYDQQSKQVIMLYRAAGLDDAHRVHLGLALSKDGYHFTRTSDKPVFSPSVDGFDGGCIEDPRIIKIGPWYFVTYACRAFPPGKYWLSGADNPYLAPERPEEAPIPLRKNWTATGLALTKDFRTWFRAGRMTSPVVDDRDVFLFPEQIAGQWVMIQRPMQWAGAGYPCEKPSIWIARGDDMLDCRDSKLLLTGRYEWEVNKVGANTPPIKTPHGWLMLHHGVGPDWHYRLGAMLMDLKDPSRVLHRTPDWLLQPEKPFETKGYYNGVVFPCGAVVIDGTLFVYYGGADQHVGVATCNLEELLAHLLTYPA